MAVTQPLPISIYGAGPAGSALAFLLASKSIAVRLHRWEYRRTLAEETLIPASAQLVQRLGLGRALDSFMESKPLRHGIQWGGEWTWREGDYASPRVARGAFDRVLVEAAVSAGATLIDCQGPPTEQTVRDGGLAVMATGSLTSCRGWTFAEEAQALVPTVALVAMIREDAGTRDSSVIEAVPEGWWWWLPVSEGATMCVLVADANEVRTRGARQVWSAARSHAAGPCHDAPEQNDAGRVATSWRRTSRSVFLAGDAACRLDPLSSQGIEKALASAEQLAAALARGHAHPEELHKLRDFMRRWDAGLFRAHARKTLAFYAAEARFGGAPFWVARHAAAKQVLGGAAPISPSSPLRVSRTIRFVDAYRFVEGELTPHRACAADDDGPALAELGGIPTEMWLALIEGGQTLADAVGKASKHPTFVAQSPAGVARQLGELTRLGFLSSD